MKQLLYLVLIFCIACNGRLTDEQRKRLKDGMKKNEIKKVSEAQLTEAAFIYGRQIASALGRSAATAKIDSLQKLYRVRIKMLHAGKAPSDATEKQLLEAYEDGAGKVQLEDNIQKTGPDSLLYTQPVTRVRPDGSQELNFAWAVRMARREVVNSIKD